MEKQNENIAKQNAAIMEGRKELQSHLNEERQSKDSIDQYMRKNKLEFYGIPSEKGENIEILLKNVLKKVNFNLNPKHISIAHRLPTPYVVRFNNRKTRNSIFELRKKFKDEQNFGIHHKQFLAICENLTRTEESCLLK